MASFSPRDMYRTSTSMLRPFAAACLVAVASMGWTAFAAAQVPNTFNNGEVADADKINENFSYVLENASGGCTVEQVDNTAEITCADGSTAVVPGYGTVVVYPEGEVGEVPDLTYNTGEIVVKDADEIVLGIAVSGSLSEITFKLTDETFPQASFSNQDSSKEVVFSAKNGGDVFYLGEDCSGIPFVENKYSVIDLPDSFYIPNTDIEEETLLFKSKRRTGFIYNGAYREPSSCESRDFVEKAMPTIPYTPAPEILNAAYPVRLEQLP